MHRVVTLKICCRLKLLEWTMLHSCVSKHQHIISVSRLIVLCHCVVESFYAIFVLNPHPALSSCAILLHPVFVSSCFVTTCYLIMSSYTNLGILEPNNHINHIKHIKHIKHTIIGAQETSFLIWKRSAGVQ